VVFNPTYVTITNPNAYNKEDKQKIKVMPQGKIAIEYSGSTLDGDKTERIGFVDSFDVDYLKSLPPHLYVMVNVF
jgi:hypothetical protein